MFPFFSLLGFVTGCELLLTSFNTSSFQFNFAKAGLAVRRDGTLERFSEPSWFPPLGSQDQWLTELCRVAESGDAYEVFYSGTGDTPTGDALGTWLPVTQDREWFLESSAPGPKLVFNGTMQIREIAQPSNIVSAAAQIVVEVLP